MLLYKGEVQSAKTRDVALGSDVHECLGANIMRISREITDSSRFYDFGSVRRLRFNSEQELSVDRQISPLYFEHLQNEAHVDHVRGPEFEVWLIQSTRI